MTHKILMRICRMMAHRLLAAAPIAAVAVVAGCLSSTDIRNSDPPTLRFVNASAESFVNVHLDDLTDPITTLSTNVAAPGCFLVLPEVHLVSFIQNDVTLEEFEAPFHSDSEYVVVLTGDGSSYRGFAVTNDQEVEAGSFGLTLINATTIAGDVYVTGVTEEPTPATRVASSLESVVSTTTQPPHVIVPGSRLRVRLFDLGSTTTPRADITLDPLDARSATVVFTPGTFPATGAIQVRPCD
jgi:hypothetical protein